MYYDDAIRGWEYKELQRNQPLIYKELDKVIEEHRQGEANG